MKLTLIILLWTMTTQVSAGMFDLSLGLGARTVPPGASLNSELGYNEYIWDDRESTKSFWQFGYVRPSVQVASSGVVNSVETEIAFFPISFFKFSGVYAQSYRMTEFSKVSCTSVGCQGWLGKVGAVTELKLGVGPVFFGGGIRLDRFDSTQTDHPNSKFLDENSMLQGSSKKDLMRTAQVFAGYALSDLWKLGLFYSRNQMGGTGETSKHLSSFAIWELRQWKLTTGLGHYQSPLYPSSMTSFFQATYQLSPGIGL